MGSQSKINLAYIAGFLDGDGSLMLQVKKRLDSKRGIRLMMTICFYQDTRHEEPLFWIRKQLGIGYISRRNDGMSELRINGFKQIKEIMKKLIPFVRFKRKQALCIALASEILGNKKINQLSKQDKSKLVKLIIDIQSENYVTKYKKNKEELEQILNLTP